MNPNEFLSAISGPPVDYLAVYDRLESGQSVDDVLAWHCRENLDDPGGVETAKAVLTAIMRCRDGEPIPCSCGKCGEEPPAGWWVVRLGLMPFIRFLTAMN